jgi:hypothetical protein
MAEGGPQQCNVRCKARENCLRCKCEFNRQKKRAFRDFHMVLKLLKKDPNCELMGHKLKTLFQNHDFDKVGNIVFEMPDGKEKQHIDLVGPCRKQKTERSPLPQPA